jgi:C4-dicarboxylate transporter DctM subunit
MFSILFGALVFSNFVNLAGLPAFLSGQIRDSGLSPTGVILLIILIYFILGMLLESLSMVLLTIPIFYPIVQALGFDLIWFGIIVIVATEISFITPPVGMNVFVLQSVLKTVPTETIFRGVMPFVLIDLVRILLFVFVPWLVLVVPRTM